VASTSRIFLFQSALDQFLVHPLQAFHAPLALPPQPVSHRPGIRHRAQPQLLQHLPLGPQFPQVFQPPPARVQHPHQRLYELARPISAPRARTGQLLVHALPHFQRLRHLLQYQQPAQTRQALFALFQLDGQNQFR